MQKLFGNQYDFLNLQPSLAEQIFHEDSYIKIGTGVNMVRKVFYGVPYDNFESQSLQKLKELMQHNNIQNNYTDDILLRFLVAYRFVMEKVIESLKNHQVWLDDPETFKQTPQVIELLQKGVIYISTRDRLYRPVIQINTQLLDPKKVQISDFISAMNIVLMVAQQYMFYKGKVENWIISIETNEVGIFNFPFGLLNQIIQVAAHHFPGCLEKIYIMNPSTSLNFSWSVIEAFIDDRSRKKIQFLKKKDFNKLKEYFDPEILETTYGGTRTLPKVFWPPSQDIPGNVGQSQSSYPPYQEQSDNFSQYRLSQKPYEPQVQYSGYQGYKSKYIQEPEADKSFQNYQNDNDRKSIHEEIKSKYDDQASQNNMRRPSRQPSQKNDQYGDTGGRKSHRSQSPIWQKNNEPTQEISIPKRNYSPQPQQPAYQQNYPQQPLQNSKLLFNDYKMNRLNELKQSRSKSNDLKIPPRDANYRACVIF